MKRSWFGLALLGILLAASLGAGWFMDRAHAPVSRELHQAAALARDGEWQEARQMSDRAAAQWQRWEGLRGSLCDHGAIEEVEAGFARLEVGREEEAGEFSAACAELARKTEAIAQAHGARWWDFL